MNIHITATVLGLLIALFGPIVVAIIADKFIYAKNRILLHLLGLSSLMAIVAGVLFIVFRYEHQTVASLGIRPFNWQTVAWGLALAAFFIYIFAPTAYWMLEHFRLGGFEKGIFKNAALPLWYLAIAVLVGSISEEVLYRGYAIERIADLTGNYWIAGIISVLIFGLAHVPMWGWGPALTTIVSGVILTVFFIWHKDLTANIIAHFVTDFSGLVIGPLLAKHKRL